MSDPAPHPEPVVNVFTAIAQLLRDARDYAQAEAAYLRLETRARLNDAITALVMFAVAATLGAGLLTALLVGVILALAPLLGAGLATLLTMTVGALVIALLTLAARTRLRRALDFGDDDDAVA